MMQSPTNLDDKGSKYELVQIPLFITGGVFIFFVIAYFLYACFTRDQDQTRDDTVDGSEATPPLSTQVSSDGIEDVDHYSPVSVTSFPLEQFSGAESCTICLEAFKIGEDVRVVPSCSHHFHDHCIRGWTEKGNQSCPKCRRLYGDIEDGSTEI
ncbi:putative RING-H2 finger protein ATL61 [Lycium ferocissimum]|uniref:putative RING-H2 finger protein ATL61 n=1 Tax=Lycium ferocissimum TaxID=112874 RepID=UPI00281665AB|nr:putative RING-H2 finger protein ATL61 [Lycium ferocissimum]